ncbi:hypothetical protein [Flavobacterium sp.]|uniref:hypothetical protein n=1 Tax=Flavobacterium sp. TaxID=239 RepID=UPI00286E869D|nr:hypothetical protein [Flavobacterium sp.]
MRILNLKWIVIVGLFFSLSLKAQSLEKMKTMSVEELATFKTNELKKELNLSENQAAKLQVVNLEFAKVALPVIKSNDAKFTVAKKLKPLDEKRDQDLEKILDKKQFELYKKNKEKKISKLRAEFLSEN